MSTKEAAEVLNISPSNAKVRLHRARLLLREHLANYFSEKDQAEVCGWLIIIPQTVKLY